MSLESEDRLLRVWTPVMLRALVGTSAMLLAVGLAIQGAIDPEAYVARFDAVRSGGIVARRESWAGLVGGLERGESRAIILAGLLVLTLVPIGRVAFSFAVFVKQRDRTFAGLTAIVLLLLGLGVWLGRVG